ncbi:MAG: hypothetical protein H6Q02_198 [Acidobacteria bacterium]|nr:hypothetical protein [Acidobacteriota bacterium]
MSAPVRALPAPAAPRDTTAEPAAVTVSLTPRERCDTIDVAALVRERVGDGFDGYRKAVYCSLHTTAGYLEQGLAARLEHRDDRMVPFIRAFGGLFPPGADYRHDRLDERRELSPEQRSSEPKNADSHLTFIAAGLRNCATYTNRPGEPVYFFDLDGVNGDTARTRRTTVLAYSREEVVARASCEVPVSRHPIDSINLGDPRAGVLPLAEELRRRHGVGRGRLDIALAAGERDAGVTVNEFETLLMRYDLTEVLRDPLRFLARQGRRMLAEPRAIAAKSLGYARYDVVHVVNELIDALNLSESAVERVLARLMAVPASRRLRLKRSVSLLVSDLDGDARVVRGTYQSPILIQWGAAHARRRTLELTLTRFT